MAMECRVSRYAVDLNHVPLAALLLYLFFYDGKSSNVVKRRYSHAGYNVFASVKPRFSNCGGATI
jgi:hypothetical protein